MRRVSYFGSHTGISSVEVVVVLAILSVLLAIAFPAVSSLRDSANATVCKNNLSEIALAMHQYRQLNEFPKPNPVGKTGGWVAAILPFLQMEPLGNELALEHPVDTVPVQWYQAPRVFTCPKQRDTRQDQPSRIRSARYVYLALPGSFADAPTNLDVAWLSSPSVPLFEDLGSKGPHWGGFHKTNGYPSVEFRKPSR